MISSAWRSQPCQKLRCTRDNPRNYFKMLWLEVRTLLLIWVDVSRVFVSFSLGCFNWLIIHLLLFTLFHCALHSESFYGCICPFPSVTDGLFLFTKSLLGLLHRDVPYLHAFFSSSKGHELLFDKVRASCTHLQMFIWHLCCHINRERGEVTPWYWSFFWCHGVFYVVPGQLVWFQSTQLTQWVV